MVELQSKTAYRKNLGPMGVISGVFMGAQISRKCTKTGVFEPP